jgi:hypothetical protein
MAPYETVGQLLDVEPVQWGLRGDPYLWRQMRTHFSSMPLPASVVELRGLLERAFESLTGHPLSGVDCFYVEGFAHGGQSSGLISPEFWREKALTLLLNRYALAE